ncbi:hypothetical protein BRAS3843_650001 [Bradyrhizobium sp. STM 3843]|nr:hypothetical protein BRAS3843_650001 [Bradyrhizobium sp. STM 3843]
MPRPNLWFLPPAFLSQAGHGGGKLPAFPAPSIFQEGGAISKARARGVARPRSRTPSVV